MSSAVVRALCLAACALVVSAPATAAQRQSVDLLMVNGKILTVDDRFRVEQAIAVKDGLIVAVGSTAELRGESTGARQVDLHGRTVVPGFNDAHHHPRTQSKRSLGDLQQVRSIAEIKARLAAKVAELGAGQWIVVDRGWDETLFVEGRKPTRQDLDQVAPDNPVLLARMGSHSAVANSRALQIAGIARDTPDPPGGRIEHDAGGEPTGILVETAQDLVSRHIPPLAPAERRAGTIAGLKALLPYGITSFSQAGGTATGFRDWQSIYAEVGADLPRGSYYLTANEDRTPEDVIGSGLRPMDGDDRLRVVATKIWADGGFTGPDAYLSKPYKGMGDFRGHLVNTPEELTEMFRKLNAAGWPVGVHTAGDATASIVVNAFARVLGETPRRDIRHHLMHYEVGMPDPADVRKMKRFGIGVAQQTNFVFSLEGLYTSYLQDDLLARVVPARSLLDQGIRFANSSDGWPTSPVLGIYAAVTRKGRSGARYSPQERLRVQEAIRSYTMGGAWMTHQEDVKGSLEPGKLADLVVLSDDILRIRPNCLLDVMAMETYVGGRLVYRRAPGDTAGAAPPHRECP